MRNIRIIENFQSFQGEGPDVGKKMLFIRFKRCNRSGIKGEKGGCPWCDTQVKMRISSEFDYPIKDIQDLVDEFNTNVTITGGEPTFSLNLSQTADIINNIKCNLFNVETNGFDLLKLINEVNKNKNVKYILSPKLFIEEDYIFYADLVNNIKDNEKVFIKLVYEDRELIIKFLEYLKTINFNTHRLYLMPEGKTKEEILEHSPIVFDACEKYLANFSSREHIIYNFV